MEEFTTEKLGSDFSITVSREHKFGTDAFLLADFANPKRRDSCCDLCSGCGIIPVLWYRFGNNPKVAYAVELQQQAVQQMEITVTAPNLRGRVLPVHADLKNITQIAKASMTLVSCNPPFKRDGGGIKCPDPARLTARHEVDCNLDDICKTASQLLNFGGRFCLCQRPERLPDIMQAMRAHNLEPKRLRFVQKRANTAPWLVLVEGKKGSAPFLNVLPPLIVQAEDGEYSEEMRKIYRFTEDF